MTEGRLQIRVLGPLEISREGRHFNAGGPRQRAVLAMLALHAGEPVPVEELAEGVWGEADEPAGVVKAIQVHVARIRASLRPGESKAIETVPGGYSVPRNAVDVDTHEFERLLNEGREQLSSADAHGACMTLGLALGLWRGPALMDLRYFPFAERFASRYDELRADAGEERVQARLALGEAAGLVPELRALVAQHPYRERLRRQLMVSLYRSGQQAAALDAYEAARMQFALDLGVDPGPELQRLHREILDHGEGLAQAKAGGVSPGVALRTPQRPLPARSQLFGREDLLNELENLVQGERLVTLTGAGGSGKTALAIELLHRVAPRLSGGAAFVDLGALARADQVLLTVASVLGVTAPLDSLGEHLASHLAQRPIAMVLDNMEHLLDAVPALVPLIESSAGPVIVTSRVPLGLRSERVMPVPPLPVAQTGQEPTVLETPSAQLLIHAARAAGVDLASSPGDLQAIADITRAVDGLPLALEIAASQTRVESVEDLARQLRRRLPGLRARGRDTPPRQQTMEAAVRWSTDRLPPDDQRAFQQLASFAGSFSLRAAAAVLEESHETTIERFSSLLDASLLVRQPAVSGTVRFRMLEPIRLTARHMAGDDGFREATARSAAWVASEVDLLCPSGVGIRRPEHLALLRAEHDNIGAALAFWAESAPERFAEVVVQLQDYWYWTRREVDVQPLVLDVLARDGLSATTRCLALVHSASTLGSLGRLRDARPVVDEAIALAERVHDEALRAEVFLQETYFADFTGDATRARMAAKKALAHARASGNGRLLLMALLNLASELVDDSDATRGEVEALLDESREVAREVDSGVTQIWVLETEAYCTKEDYVAALRLWRAAHRLALRYGAREKAAVISNGLGLCLLRLGRTQEAWPHLISSAHSAHLMGHQTDALYAISSIAEAEVARGHWERAVTLFAAVDSIAEGMGARGAITSALPDGESQLILGLLREAEEHLGDTAAGEARQVGRAMSYTEAIAFAVADDAT